MNVEAQLTRCEWTRAEGDERRQCIRRLNHDGLHAFESNATEGGYICALHHDKSRDPACLGCAKVWRKNQQWGAPLPSPPSTVTGPDANGLMTVTVNEPGPKARACRECGESTFGKLCPPCNALPDMVDPRLNQCNRIDLYERFSVKDMGLCFTACEICPHRAEKVGGGF